ncbi:hypothetical protein SAMN05216505_11253 [Streptomyces prasinopilosus]|uniref:Uncharacterized protein n=1 Tax=Streptomyces prasinopilosus TaxID=67344 RepID=A0A1G6XSF4_9ACTN|nr:hypothetical protein SAMN05216505_11253 [Streptomyces prasinopilosus]
MPRPGGRSQVHRGRHTAFMLMLLAVLGLVLSVGSAARAAEHSLRRTRRQTRYGRYAPWIHPRSRIAAPLNWVADGRALAPRFSRLRADARLLRASGPRALGSAVAWAGDPAGDLSGHPPRFLHGSFRPGRLRGGRCRHRRRRTVRLPGTARQVAPGERRARSDLKRNEARRARPPRSRSRTGDRRPVPGGILAGRDALVVPGAGPSATGRRHRPGRTARSAGGPRARGNACRASRAAVTDRPVARRPRGSSSRSGAGAR